MTTLGIIFPMRLHWSRTRRRYTRDRNVKEANIPLFSNIRTIIGANFLT